MRPPWASTASLQNVSPRPRPLRATGCSPDSTCTNGSKTFSRISGGIPLPASATRSSVPPRGATAVTRDRRLGRRIADRVLDEVGQRSPEQVLVGVDPIGLERAPEGYLAALGVHAELREHLVHERAQIDVGALGRQLPFVRLARSSRFRIIAVQLPRLGADLRGGLARARRTAPAREAEAARAGPSSSPGS